LPTELRRRAILAGAVAGSFLVTASPWLIYNRTQGVTGFARGAGWVLWYGAAMNDLLDPSYPVDEGIRKTYQTELAPGISDHHVLRVVWATGAQSSPEQDKKLGDWARASIKAKPFSYAFAAYHILRWQLGIGLPSKPPIYDELPFFLQRLSEDG